MGLGSAIYNSELQHDDAHRNSFIQKKGTSNCQQFPQAFHATQPTLSGKSFPDELKSRNNSRSPVLP